MTNHGIETSDKIIKYARGMYGYHKEILKAFTDMGCPHFIIIERII